VGGVIGGAARQMWRGLKDCKREGVKDCSKHFVQHLGNAFKDIGKYVWKKAKAIPHNIAAWFQELGSHVWQKHLADEKLRKQCSKLGVKGCMKMYSQIRAKENSAWSAGIRQYCGGPPGHHVAPVRCALVHVGSFYNKIVNPIIDDMKAFGFRGPVHMLLNPFANIVPTGRLAVFLAKAGIKLSGKLLKSVLGDEVRGAKRLFHGGKRLITGAVTGSVKDAGKAVKFVGKGVKDVGKAVKAVGGLFSGLFGGGGSHKKKKSKSPSKSPSKSKSKPSSKSKSTKPTKSAPKRAPAHKQSKKDCKKNGKPVRCPSV